MGQRKERSGHQSHQCVPPSIPCACAPLSLPWTDPATTEELGTVPEMGLEETKEAIDAASKAFKTWSKTTAKVCLHFVSALPPTTPTPRLTHVYAATP